MNGSSFATERPLTDAETIAMLRREVAYQADRADKAERNLRQLSTRLRYAMEIAHSEESTDA